MMGLVGFAGFSSKLLRVGDRMSVPAKAKVGPAPAVTDEWVAVDFETASVQATPCQVAAVRVRDGSVVDEFSTLVFQPPESFAPFNVYLHGITAEAVADAPPWPDVRDRLVDFVGAAPLVAHNAAFDIGVIRQSCSACGLEWPNLSYACTLAIARQVWPGVRSYSLHFLCAELGISVSAREHEALGDAEAAAVVLLSALRERQAADLPTLLEGARLRLGELTADGWRGSTLRPLTARDVRERVDPSEEAEGSALFGKTVVFTGALGIPRRRAWELVAVAGGAPADGVTAKTDYLVCGYQDLMKLAAGESKSSKFRKAEALRAKGSPIEFLSEQDFFEMLDDDVHPDASRARIGGGKSSDWPTWRLDSR